MSGRRYIATLESVSVSTTVDLFEIVPEANTIIKLLEFHINQETLVGDSFAEANTINFITEHSTNGDNISVNVQPLVSGDHPFTGIVSRNFVTLASGGSPTTVYANTWHNRIPWSIIFSPETNRIISPGKRMVIRISNITNVMNVSVSLIFQEYGGLKRIFGTVHTAFETDIAFNHLYIRIATSNERSMSVLNTEINFASTFNSAFAVTISGGV